MSEHIFKVDVAAWVQGARVGQVIYQQRQTLDIVPNTIAITVPPGAKTGEVSNFLYLGGYWPVCSVLISTYIHE